MPLTHTSAVLDGHYQPHLVVVSVLLAILASYAALDVTGRITVAHGKARSLWLVWGAVAMGLGIWSMHYIGMLAYILPVPVLYDWPTVLASLLAAIVASGIALWIASRPGVGTVGLGIGAVLMGAGIASMHYIGMDARRLPAMCHYSPGLVGLSVVLAIATALVALQLTFHFRSDAASAGWRKGAGAIVMGLAIPILHYTGMAAVTFVPMATTGSLAHALEISTLGTLVISIFTVAVLSSTIFSAFLGRRLSAQTFRLQYLMDDAVLVRENLAETEERLRLTLRSAGISVWNWNLGLNQVDADDSSEAILALPARSFREPSRVRPAAAPGESGARAAGDCRGGGKARRVSYRVPHCASGRVGANPGGPRQGVPGRRPSGALYRRLLGRDGAPASRGTTARGQ
jgi:NO-binding membrane sensor protein with MHYT domain